MTSIERDEGNAYGGVREPEYGILTYTWGRWRVSDGPRLDVAGIDWDIPAVDERAFTLENFQRVIQKMSLNCDFAWMDVACIDQKRYAVKMDEVWRQGGIFSNAKFAYVWLWTLPLTSLEAAIGDIMECDTTLWPSHEREQDIALPLARLQQSVSNLLGDGWFSSLWTLQEGLLKRSAWILSREGEYATKDGLGSPLYIGLCVFDSLWRLRRTLEFRSSMGYNNSSQLEICDSIVESIKRAGYAGMTCHTNPNIQYGLARLRFASDELDRIYGIISLYNLKVGATRPGSDASRPFTFQELEDEFAAILNSTSPLLGQMFVHTEKPRRTWQITQTIRVPAILHTYSVSDSSFHCEITATPQGCARIKGERCPFTEFHRFHMAPENGYSRRRSSRVFKLFAVILDDYVAKDRASLPSFPDNDFFYLLETLNHQARETAAALSRHFLPEELSVLYLGRTSVTSKYSMVGLLLEHTSADGRQCRRLGICVWEGTDGSLVPSEHWLHFDGEMW